MSPTPHLITVLNARLGRVRREHIDGRQYLVAPFISIVPGVLNGSKGAGRLPALGTGVYMIWNRISDKTYVGSSAKSVAKRLTWHLRKLREQLHKNEHLQRAWNKYGESAFVFVVLEKCSPKECITREQEHIDFHRAANKLYGYNKNPSSENCYGVRRSAETRQRMSEAAKLRWQTNPLPAEARERIASKFRGRTLPQSTVEKMSASNLGRKQTPEQIEKAAAYHRGRKRSEETCARISAAKRGLPWPV